MNILKSIFGESNFQNLEIAAYKTDYIDTPQAHVLVDVRTTGEYKGGHLPKAINIPLSELHARVDEIPQGKPVVVVCATGNRSRSGANAIAKAGHEEVYNLVGGTMRWRMMGYEVK